MNTVSAKKTSNIQVVEIQITLQDTCSHQYNENPWKLQAFVNLDNWGSDNRGHTIMQKKGLQAVSFKL